MLNIASAVIFMVVTALLVFYWPPPEEHEEISASRRGCFSLNKAIMIVIGPHSISIKSKQNSVNAIAGEGADKTGRYILSTPGILIKRSGKFYNIVTTDTAKSFRIGDTQTLYSYQEEGELVKFTRVDCQKIR